jgi:hypothetical protein
MVSGTITLNGVTREIRSIDYRRVEYTDGTVHETGRPLDVPSGADVGEIIQAAFKPRKRKGV